MIAPKWCLFYKDLEKKEKTKDKFIEHVKKYLLLKNEYNKND